MGILKRVRERRCASARKSDCALALSGLDVSTNALRGDTGPVQSVLFPVGRLSQCASARIERCPTDLFRRDASLQLPFGAHLTTHLAPFSGSLPGILKRV